MMTKIACVLFCVLLTSCAELTHEDVGTVTGGVVGGLLGSQFGGGGGKIAAAAGGALLGAIIGGSIGKSMDRQDRMMVANALEKAPTGKDVHWTNPDTGNSYDMRATRTYYVREQPCREYTTRAIIGGKSEQIYGKACRKADGSWQVVS